MAGRNGGGGWDNGDDWNRAGRQKLPSTDSDDEDNFQNNANKQVLDDFESKYGTRNYNTQVLEEDDDAGPSTSSAYGGGRRTSGAYGGGRSTSGAHGGGRNAIDRYTQDLDIPTQRINDSDDDMDRSYDRSGKTDSSLDDSRARMFTHAQRLPSIDSPTGDKPTTRKPSNSPENESWDAAMLLGSVGSFLSGKNKYVPNPRGKRKEKIIKETTDRILCLLADKDVWLYMKEWRLLHQLTADYNTTLIEKIDGDTFKISAEYHLRDDTIFKNRLLEVYESTHESLYRYRTKLVSLNDVDFMKSKLLEQSKQISVIYRYDNRFDIDYHSVRPDVVMVCDPMNECTIVLVGKDWGDINQCKLLMDDYFRRKSEAIFRYDSLWAKAASAPPDSASILVNRASYKYAAMKSADIANLNREFRMTEEDCGGPLKVTLKHKKGIRFDTKDTTEVILNEMDVYEQRTHQESVDASYLRDKEQVEDLINKCYFEFSDADLGGFLMDYYKSIVTIVGENEDTVNIIRSWMVEQVDTIYQQENISASIAASGMLKSGGKNLKSVLSSYVQKMPDNDSDDEMETSPSGRYAGDASDVLRRNTQKMDSDSDEEPCSRNDDQNAREHEMRHLDKLYHEHKGYKDPSVSPDRVEHHLASLGFNEVRPFAGHKSSSSSVKKVEDSRISNTRVKKGTDAKPKTKTTANYESGYMVSGARGKTSPTKDYSVKNSKSGSTNGHGGTSGGRALPEPPKRESGKPGGAMRIEPAIDNENTCFNELRKPNIKNVPPSGRGSAETLKGSNKGIIRPTSSGDKDKVSKKPRTTSILGSIFGRK